MRVHDPEAMANVRRPYGDKLTYCDRPYGALEGADGLAIVTEWQEFRNPDFEVMRRLLNRAVIFDGRNLYEPKTHEVLWVHLLRNRPRRGESRARDLKGASRGGIIRDVRPAEVAELADAPG